MQNFEFSTNLNFLRREKCNLWNKNGDSGVKIDPILSTEIFILIIFYEGSLAATSNFDHTGSFSSSIDWWSQKHRKSCATGSKVTDTIKFYKIPIGDHRHAYMWNPEMNWYIAHLVEVNELCIQYKKFQLPALSFERYALHKFWGIIASEWNFWIDRKSGELEYFLLYA